MSASYFPSSGQSRTSSGQTRLQKARERPIIFSKKRDWLSCTPMETPLPSLVKAYSSAVPSS